MAAAQHAIDAPITSILTVPVSQLPHKPNIVGGFSHKPQQYPDSAACFGGDRDQRVRCSNGSGW